MPNFNLEQFLGLYLSQGKPWHIKTAADQLTRSLIPDVLHIHESAPQTGEEATRTPGYFARYMSVRTLYSIIKAEDGKNPGLRLYDTLGMNDPNEGRWLREELKPYCPWLADARDTEAFVGSFMGGDEKVGNDLMYWRLYGDDGLGCSIQFPANDVKLLPISKLKLQRVLYVGNGCTAHSEDSRQSRTHAETGGAGTDPHIQQLVQCLTPCFESVRRAVQQIEEGQQSREQIENDLKTAIWQACDGIKFLYKARYYQYENEYRYVVLRDDLQRLGLERMYDFKPDGPYLRQYVLPEDLLAVNLLKKSGSKVVIGPRVPNKERMATNLQEIARSSGLNGPVFSASQFGYQKVW